MDGVRGAPTPKRMASVAGSSSSNGVQKSGQLKHQQIKALTVGVFESTDPNKFLANGFDLGLRTWLKAPRKQEPD